MHALTTFSALMVTISVASAYVYQDDNFNFEQLKKLPYCNKLNNIMKCCNGREDDCSHDFAGTKCYCDEFCRRKPRNLLHDDCCPDYDRTCGNYVETEDVPPGNLMMTTPPPGYTTPGAPRVCHLGQQKTENCNTCTCVEVDGYPDWRCSYDKCIINKEIIDEVNRLNEGWTARNYSEFWGRTLSDGLALKLGTLKLSPDAVRMFPDSTYMKYGRFPDSFDARMNINWTGMITPVIDQGWCGSDWAVSTAAVASDRFFIQSNGAQKTRLSAQYLLCSGNKGCKGGHIEHAWNVAKKYGLVDETCLPFEVSSEASCPRIKFFRNQTSVAGCNKTAKLYHTSPWKKLGSPDDVMYEIFHSGPLQAIMEVGQDLFHYAGGVYRRLRSSHVDKESRLHAVRVLGWGEENSGKYWVIANSWGKQWGEGGTFRVAREPNPFTMVVVTNARVDKVEMQASRFGRRVSPYFKK